MMAYFFFKLDKVQPEGRFMTQWKLIHFKSAHLKCPTMVTAQQAYGGFGVKSNRSAVLCVVVAPFNYHLMQVNAFLFFFPHSDRMEG